MAATGTPVQSHSEAAAQAGLVAGIFCYVCWGFLPLLFKALQSVSPAVIVADRSFWALILIGVILFVSGRMPEVRAALADPATRRSMVFSAILLGSNWLIYVYAVVSGQVLESSFGYFINPLMNVAIGMVMFGEKQSRWQIVALGLAAVAIGIQAVGLSGFPFIALSLAGTFAAYGYCRKTAKVSSAAGAFVETLFMAPFALAFVAYTFVIDGGPGPHGDPGLLALLMLTGPATAIPLLLFAFSAQRVRMTTMGMLQYISPSLQFLIAVLVFGEHLSLIGLLSFGLIWISLIIYSVDAVARRRVAAPEPT